MNLYEIFDLPTDCSEKELKKRYRELCILYHPDKHPEIDPQKFIDLQTAYEILSDPIQRKYYDLHTQLPFLENVDLNEQEYELLYHYYSQVIQTQEYKLMRLLYKSLPKHVIQKFKDSFQQKQSPTINVNELDISPKWIYIQNMEHSQSIHLYVSMEDSYKNKVKRVFLQTNYGIMYLFLRNFQRQIIIDNKTTILTIHLHTKNGTKCYRKNNDLYYIVPQQKLYHIIELPDKKRFMTKHSIIHHLGFTDGINQGKLILVKFIPTI